MRAAHCPQRVWCKLFLLLLLLLLLLVQAQRGGSFAMSSARAQVSHTKQVELQPADDMLEAT
jgi:hypothetical protein